MEPVSIDGTFFRNGPSRFVARGLVYQSLSGPVRSPLRDERIDDLKRDIELFRELGINALRVYRIDLDQAFHYCMQELANAGIYVVVDLTEPSYCISRLDPQESYTTNLLGRFCAKIDVLSSYPNVLGVCVANSVINGPRSTDPDIPNVFRALIRDLKIHMRMTNEKHGNRVLPICVCDTAYAALSTQSFDDLTHLSEPDSAIDFYMLIMYDNAKGNNSKWETLGPRFSQARIPLLIAEYGSNVVRPRPFSEIDMLYSDDFLRQFSGGFVYQFEEGSNAYGLVKLKDGGIEKLPDFQSLKEKLQAHTSTSEILKEDRDKSRS